MGFTFSYYISYSVLAYRSSPLIICVHHQLHICWCVLTENWIVESAVIFVLDFDHSPKSYGGDIFSFIPWHFPMNLEVWSKYLIIIIMLKIKISLKTSKYFLVLSTMHRMHFIDSIRTTWAHYQIATLNLESMSISNFADHTSKFELWSNIFFVIFAQNQNKFLSIILLYNFGRNLKIVLMITAKP